MVDIARLRVIIIPLGWVLPGSGAIEVGISWA
jgi:hypothetical protein